MMVRYQEWEDGLHNFNDKVILTLHFCLYLRNCLQVKYSIREIYEYYVTILHVKCVTLIFHIVMHSRPLIKQLELRCRMRLLS